MKTLKDLKSFFGFIRKKDVIKQFEKLIPKIEMYGTAQAININKNRQMCLEEFLYDYPGIDKTPIQTHDMGKSMGIN